MDGSIRPEILGSLDRHELGKTRAGATDRLLIVPTSQWHMCAASL
jgi:hypothetical protein